MKVLVLGGTSFVGRHMVEELVSKGHEVILFNRGKSNPGLFPNLKKIKGDRRKDAAKIGDEKWDAVLDTSAYTPADLQPIMENIRTDHYTFISTISVYNDFTSGPVKESSSVFRENVKGDQVTSDTYGPFKVMCEQLIKEEIGGKALIIRPGIVIGPFDPTDRFTYWAMKLNDKSTVLIPGSKERKVQWIDARDLARFTVMQLETKVTGVFNVVADPVSMKEFVEQISDRECKTIWADDQYLIEEGVEAFELPFWIPNSEEFPDGFILADNKKAKSAGLTFRTLKQSAKETLEWIEKQGDFRLKAGISKTREQELLKKLGE
ncbi:NAD-dependent epimerase/dehydratase family protein [uncultured Planococcus sp.]|uniref:NAD-dependent epimerase/dehydratase family protein n=1 Tax=uncultured Planococcus sp. TaxID=337815 RepID=UPI0026066A8E|nr:NAD-dependent epimerase/dehydratase family protein [uncultured Planococcus sp.]